MAERIDVNRATREELIRLPGVGGTLADRIIAHRAQIGRFESVDDLVHVSGLSERMLADGVSPSIGEQALDARECVTCSA